MHFKTTLLAVCLIAKTLLLKLLPVIYYEEKLNAVKHFRVLVNERWKFDMESLAFQDLNEKHGSLTLPITSDVIKFREYAVRIAEDSITSLNKNSMELSSFKKLTKSSLVLTILLNRKRVGGVQYIKINKTPKH